MTERQQAFWLIILLGVVAALAGALGFHFGSQTQQIIVHIDQGESK